MLPTLAQLELRVLKLIDAALANQPVESTQVEMKAKWPEAKQAARIIGGMCNAAGGQSVLLLIGVDEKGAVITGATSNEVSDWYAKLSAEYDREVPALVHTLSVHSGDKTVVALLFDSSRAPYVIKNPTAGQPSAGPVQYEVPWREGNHIRTARREHLLRILVPETYMPDLECLSATITYQHGDGLYWRYRLQANLFASVAGRCTLIAHRTRLVFTPDYLGSAHTSQPLVSFGIDPISSNDMYTRTLHETSHFQLIAEDMSQSIGPLLPAEIIVTAYVAVDRADKAVPLEIKLRRYYSLGHDAANQVVYCMG